MKTIIETYKAKDGHRWRMKAANGKIIADGGEAYTRKPSCGDGVRRVLVAGIHEVIFREE